MANTSSIPNSALYRTIHRQPEIISDILERCSEEARQAANLVAGARRVYLAGTGTSSHAAVVGEHLLRSVGVDAYATTNFDLVSYPRPFGPEDVLIAISHRGSKQYGKAAIALAKETGARVIGLTGIGSPMEGPAVILQTAPSEESSTHTASYIGNLTGLAMIACAVGAPGSASRTALLDGLARLPDVMRELLDREDGVRPAAAALAARGRLVLAGAGPNAVTAREGALKVKESSFLVAEGFELETILHGGLQPLEVGDVAVVVLANGPAVERSLAVVKALDMIGARVLVVADAAVAARVPAVEGSAYEGRVVTFPSLPEVLSPLAAVVPLQLLAAFTADLRGTNADAFRADDPVYKAANASYAL
ncbi:MAG TPA: SIS domain-containing protein [Chloroflexota bacterium]|nr:SIS domain-containing protein [Chloroflexota bacterium]